MSYVRMLRLLCLCAVLTLFFDIEMSEAKKNIDGCVELAYVFCPSWDFQCVMDWWAGCVFG